MLRKINSDYRNYGRSTILSLNVFYASSIITFLFSFLCYFHLDIRGVIFNTLLIYSLLNSLNIVFFYYHENILNSYVLASIIAYFTVVIISIHSGGINSPALSFLASLIFFGYLLKKSFGNTWFVIVALTVLFFYVLEKKSYDFVNELNSNNITEFNVLFLFFSIVLLGGFFGRLMNKNYADIKVAKNEIQRRNNEKTVMLKEIHHRVKNNLQVINSLLRIQSRGVDNVKIKSMFLETQGRVITMARLHERIYKSNDLKSISVPDHFNKLVNDLVTSHQLNKKISIDIKMDDIFMSIDTLLPLSLIINELFTNSLKHAFENTSKGVLFLKLFEINKNNFRLIIGDNGSNIYDDILSNHSNSTGVRLIKTFIRQLEGEIEQINYDKGTFFEILFSVK